MEVENTEIDDSLYSRQRYVLGDSAMKKMARANVLLIGLGGLGVEIAKNIVLAGIKSLTLFDLQSVTYKDLATQFFLREDDVKLAKNRAEASLLHLKELNPYVSVQIQNDLFGASGTELMSLLQFQCVILTEVDLSLKIRINNFCRSQNPSVKFIAADVYGVFSYCFCDFGDQFQVFDSDGEEPREVFIADISKSNPGIVTCLDNQRHDFEDGTSVSFKEVKGMTALNAASHQITVISPYAFSIGDTSGPEFAAYQTGGIATEVKLTVIYSFQSLQKQLASPDFLSVDFSKINAPNSIHLGIHALQKYQEKRGQLPRPWCQEDAQELVALAQQLGSQTSLRGGPETGLDQKLVMQLSWTASGCLQPLAAAMAGVVAQEALISITGKFSPLQQWLYLDVVELLNGFDITDAIHFLPRNDRYDPLRCCVGDELVSKLASLRLFMVGCGAIGCEMMKNYALLGIASRHPGQITVTDNDLIEKSNLNRQFLFRSRHIQEPKSVVAAQSTLQINSELKIEAHQHKVCPQTEQSVFNDKFFNRQDLVVNALDNVEARRYMDSRCVVNQRALLESGTLGVKGHVQVIVPHLTESYTSQQDPPEKEVPYCTLKSFPATIQHTIQWARDKFESLLSQKAAMFSQFWETHGPPEIVVQKLREGQRLDNVVQVVKFLKNRPQSWLDCITLARIKFEKYFNYKAKQLLHAFPADARLKDGSLFWQSPKRPPLPIQYNSENQLHLSFVVTLARLYAYMCLVPYSEDGLQDDNLRAVIQTVYVPEFMPSSKRIEIDELAKKPKEEMDLGDEANHCIEILNDWMKYSHQGTVWLQTKPIEFEKDDDSNGHIDFVTASANLRAGMYSIEGADRLKIKKIAGHIVPAIATTTALVSGLVAIELIKVVKGSKLEDYKNCFINLALPSLIFSQPAPAPQTAIRPGLSYTMWDKWNVQGRPDTTLADFIAIMKERYQLETTVVCQGVKMIYMPIMPGHAKRLGKTMVSLLKPVEGTEYVDLMLAFQAEMPDSEDDTPGPLVRYYYGL